MKLLKRDTSSFRFLMLGGLLCNRDFTEGLTHDVPELLKEENYRSKARGFGTDEENVRKYLMDLLKELGWDKVEKDHDIIAEYGDEKILIECKRYDSRLVYIDEHKGGARGETCVEELQRNLKRTGIKWGVLADGVTFRLYYNEDLAPDLSEAFIEFALGDIMDSTHRWPDEFHWLIDFLKPVSVIRRKDPTLVSKMTDQQVKKVMRLIRRDDKYFKPVMKALAVACLEDMGVRPLHTRITSIKSATTKAEINNIFESIESDDPDFHSPSDYLTNNLATEIYALLDDLEDVDFSNIDHEFFGIIYQKFINNGNASHYTSTALSRDMANYLASRSGKSQRPTTRPIYLQENDYLLDPALGSGQLLRGLLPFHKVFFRGGSSGIEGWRKLASHFMGRDIDEGAIWVAKLNIWLATAAKGEPLVLLDEFKKLDVIDATISRQAGESIKQAFRIDDDKNIAACVCNPPWDAFRSDRRRGIVVDQDLVRRIRRSLDINAHWVNRAQIFLKIIQLLGEECRNMRFSIILPDSIFIDMNDPIRAAVSRNIDFYYSYPKNVDPLTKKRLFGDVDNTRKFGIVFGRSHTNFEHIRCYPFGNNDFVEVSEVLSTVGEYNVWPLLSHTIVASFIRKWKAAANRFPAWKQGEYNQTNWANVTGREESERGRNFVISGSAFCDNENAWSKFPVDQNIYWKRLSSINDNDRNLANQGRTIFSDYINNSKKLNSASYLPPNSGLNVTNTLNYSLETHQNDWLIIDSVAYGVLIEAYGTSQHMNAWRMTALGLPTALETTEPLEAQFELIQRLDLNFEEAIELYLINQSWLESTVSFEEWVERLRLLPSNEAERNELEGLIEEALTEIEVPQQA